LGAILEKKNLLEKKFVGLNIFLLLCRLKILLKKAEVFLEKKLIN